MNSLLFYVGWFICVVTHNASGAVLGCIIAVINILLMRYKKLEVSLILGLAMCGLLNDAIAYKLNIFKFNYTENFISIQNLWLLSLWILFLSTFNGCLSYFKKCHINILILFGMIGGAFSYYLASKMNAISFINWWSLIYIAIDWAILFPLLFKTYHNILR